MAVLTIDDVTATGNVDPLIPQSQSILANWVQVQSTSANGDARIGDSHISSTRGAILTGGGSQFFPAVSNANPYNLNGICIKAAAPGDTFQVMYNQV